MGAGIFIFCASLIAVLVRYINIREKIEPGFITKKGLVLCSVVLIITLSQVIYSYKVHGVAILVLQIIFYYLIRYAIIQTGEIPQGSSREDIKRYIFKKWLKKYLSR